MEQRQNEDKSAAGLSDSILWSYVEQTSGSDVHRFQSLGLVGDKAAIAAVGMVVALLQRKEC